MGIAAGPMSIVLVLRFRAQAPDDARPLILSGEARLR
jgi:hypothetical protein